MDVPPFYSFWHCEIFRNNFFVLKLGFLSPSTLYPILFLFHRPAFFYAMFFLIVFIEVPSIFNRNETFCEHKGLLRTLDTMRLTGDLCIRKIILQFFNFEWFSIEKGGLFLLFPVGENGFRVLCVSFRAFFGAVKLMKF